MRSIALTVYQGLAGDSNARAIPGAAAMAAELTPRLGVAATAVGHPEPVLDAHWDVELAAAGVDLDGLATVLDQAMTRGARPVTALTRCAAALATLPVVVRHRPDACVVWLDAHADLNTPDTTGTGYLGGMALAGAAGAWASGLGAGLPFGQVVLVGVRDVDPAEQRVMDTSGLAFVRVGPRVADDLRAAVAGRPVYVHVDCDVLEPDLVPTDYSAPGGLTLGQLREVADALAEGEVIGVEIAEFESTWHDGGHPVSPAPVVEALEPLWQRLTSD
ncbi:arginase family protein [Luteitalea sp.]|jgi:arginase family enzyme|uniref:arginase family protein n=1 Tax=Luteitalea sp. TaxID=2004800 RepID=UPI0037C68C89